MNQSWREQIQERTALLRQTHLYPFFVIGQVMLYGINIPGSYTDVGFIFFYPIYGNPIMLSMFTTGTWQAVYTLDWLMEKETNSIYNEKVFKFYTQGSMFVYLCHDLWITIIATYVVKPLTSASDSSRGTVSFPLCLFLMLFGVELLSNFNYYLFLKIGRACCGRREVRGGNEASREIEGRIEEEKWEESVEEDYGI